MSDAVGSAKFVEYAPATRGVTGAERPGRIINTGMDDLAVARGHAVADAAGGLGDDHVVAANGRRTGDRKPDNACANNENLHGFRPCWVYSRQESRWRDHRWRIVLR